MKKLWTDIEPGADAIFDDNGLLKIIYINEQANDGNGSFEIETIDRERVLRLYEDVNGNACEFFDLLPDVYQGEWHYCDNGMEEFDYLVKVYDDADFIVGRDGGIEEEFNYIINWANKTKNESVYYATFKLDARYVARIRAADLQEAKRLAVIFYQDADFGDAEDIDGELIMIEDEDGNYLFEK